MRVVELHFLLRATPRVHWTRGVGSYLSLANMALVNYKLNALLI